MLNRLPNAPIHLPSPHSGGRKDSGTHDSPTHTTDVATTLLVGARALCSRLVRSSLLARSARGRRLSGTYLSDQILVGFKPGTPAWDRAGSHASLGDQGEGRIPEIDVEIVEVPKGRSVEGLIKMYEKNPNVVFAEPDYVATLEMTPDDPKYPEQWAHPYVNTPAAWDMNSGSTSVTIAVLDTGLDMTHPEIAARVVSGYDFVNGDTDPSDDHGHGTRVTGLAAATGNNTMGVAGMDWNARIMPVKVMSASGTGSISALAKGITYAADQRGRRDQHEPLRQHPEQLRSTRQSSTQTTRVSRSSQLLATVATRSLATPQPIPRSSL
jgi:hypothetical protein